MLIRILALKMAKIDFVGAFRVIKLPEKHVLESKNNFNQFPSILFEVTKPLPERAKCLSDGQNTSLSSQMAKIGPVGAFRAIKIAEKFSSDVQKLF